jgi:hypothetical protein
MANIIKILRSSVTGNRPPVTATVGEPYINFADRQFGVYDAAPIDLLAVRFWVSTAAYVLNDCVLSAGELYRCITANTNSPPPSANWAQLIGGGGGPTPSDTPPIMNGVAAPGTSLLYSRGDHVHPTDTTLLSLSGGTMAGQITTLPPVAGTDAANKDYVDNLIGNLQLFLGTWEVAANTPDITAGASVQGDYYMAVTADPNVHETAPAGIPGIGGQDVGNGDLVLWNGTIWQTVRGSGLTMIEASQLYLALAGGTMTGPLLLAANPTVALQAANKDYVDNALIDAGTY